MGYATTSCTFYLRPPKKAEPTQPAANEVVVSVGEASSVGEVAGTVEAVTVDASDLLIKKSSNSNHEYLFIEDDTEFESDMHEEGINLRAERRTYQKRKRRERIPNDPVEVSLGEVGPNLKFNETKVVDKSLKDKVVRDEPVYCSSDEYSVESDS
ncbi:hypothetical protein CQW23_21253 [Capsicum baccatum]|uniref:Uncharacterized protein n=1 Tax=Capsicum baccatum TaxID=33114 RepID=A0A2G2VXH3_CAPBA|nr:hypothetical protein CQW23_21253 [Capsicum baccatum]